LRDLYLLDPTVVFLNHGSFGACPRPIFERYQEWQLELEQQPVEFFQRRHDGLIREALHNLGDYIETSSENLVFVPNATTGLNMAIRSLKLQAGDQILTTDHEYGALNLTWEYIRRETGIEIVPVKLPLPMMDDKDTVNAIWQAVTPRTKIIFLSHITSPTALILPVEEICKRARRAGIMTVIDGAHVLGHLPINLDEMGADFYSANCHKWLCAPKGSAFLYVHPEHHALIDPLTISWGWDGETLFERTRWQGTREIAAFLAVSDAIRFQEEHDWATIYQQCHDLAIEAMHRVCEISGLPPIAMPRFFGQMVAAPLPDNIDPITLKNKLYEQYRVEVPITEINGKYYVRVSIQAYNTREDVDALIQALENLL
jgi:isopenicillin-N epimerase